ncbi:MAG TPA: SDR family oxidoreductase [Kofleriaceae bacterium]|jgi:NADP-dependent 3-hydroxy acid dehydrogenase YdfG
MSNTAGKVIALTGASSGIGEATAVRLAAAGAKLVLGARGEAKLADLAEHITAAGGSAVYAVTDVRRRADVDALVALATETFGRLDVMINNAGIGPISLMDELRVDDWIDMVDVNIKGVLYGIAAALPVFRAQKSGHIINTLSTAGIKIVPTMAVYAGTKNAVRTISEGLRQEAGPDLRVTVISPGMIATKFADSITSPTVRASIAKQAGDIAIPADAIARAIAFAIDQPRDVDVGEIVVRPTAQG